jgi:heme-degrading monooxygenase HmoA
MIARFWTAEIARGHTHAYADHLKSQVLTTLRKVDGYIGAKLLERETNDGVEIVVITFWESFGSIREFAGPDLEKAVISDDILSLFLQYDQRVRHYKVVVTDDPQQG